MIGIIFQLRLMRRRMKKGDSYQNYCFIEFCELLSKILGFNIYLRGAQKIIIGTGNNYPESGIRAREALTSQKSQTTTEVSILSNKNHEPFLNTF